VARLGGLALLAGGLALVYRGRVRRLQRLHAAVLAERGRIAANIHDSLEQSLAGLRLQVEAAALTLDRDLPSTRANLRAMAELIQDGVVDLRSSIDGLRSTPVDTGQLAAALEAKVRRVTAGTSIGASVETSGAPQQLSWYQATQILYIAREALANALKHARASRIRMALDTSTPGQLRLSVDDDGLAAAGRPQTGAALAGGTGVAGMKRRAELLGGHLTVESGEGPGTLVRLDVPIGEKPSHPARSWRRPSGDS
jgi:signal transduction histidine kinase